MLTNREAYFSLKNINNEYLTDYVIKLLICEVEGFSDFTELSLKFSEECRNSNKLYDFAERIKKGEPYQYVMNKAYFLNSPFYVDKNVLIPRQETEQLFGEICKKIEDLQSFSPKLICDMCTGSGCLGISFKGKFLDSTVVCTDIDLEALNVARKNALNKNLEIIFKDGDLLEAISGLPKFDVLVCNPPYIDSIDDVDPQVLKHEPHLALFATPGISFYKRIIPKINEIMSKKYVVGFEIGENQKDQLIEILNIYLKNTNYEFKIDIYGKTRFLIIWNDGKE